MGNLKKMEAVLALASLSVLSVEGCRCPGKREVTEHEGTDRAWVLLGATRQQPWPLSAVSAFVGLMFSYEVSLNSPD